MGPLGTPQDGDRILTFLGDSVIVMEQQAHKGVICIVQTHIWVRPQAPGPQSRIRVRPPALGP